MSIYYDKINEKIKKGIFRKGNKCSSTKSTKNRNYYIENFYDEKVYEYIKQNISNPMFDKQFFKDLIETNRMYANIFERNCFEIMPLEYIDEEMCSLAIIVSTGWNDSKWFYSVIKRKKEALTEDLWKLGANLYSTMDSTILEKTPNEYKDKDYYKAMLSITLTNRKEGVIDKIPKEKLTSEFLKELLDENFDNIMAFNEEALETVIKFEEEGIEREEKCWKYAVLKKGETIRWMKLNDERIKFFLEHYDKDSDEYDYYFKEKYKKYKKHQKNIPNNKTQENLTNITKNLPQLA